MPYSGTEDLPEAVKQHLTVHARHIYLKAFNNAYGEYARPSEGRARPNHAIRWRTWWPGRR